MKVTLFALLLAQADPAALVERLRSDDIEVRDRAEARLGRIGAPAEAALEEASRDPDPEVASRALRLLLDIAPHRREVDRALRHLLTHLRAEIERRDVPSLKVLAELLTRTFPDHPLSGDVALARIPEAEAGARFTYPSLEAWTRARDPFRDAVAATLREGETCAACVDWRLRTMKVGLAFENANLNDILIYLRDISGLNLLIDGMPSDEAKHLDLDRAVTIEAKDVTLAEALERLLKPYGMAFQVAGEEGVVLIRPLRKAE